MKFNCYFLSLAFVLTATISQAQAPSIQWQKSLGGSYSDAAYSIQQTTDGGFIVAGYSQSNDGDVSGNHGSYDYWVVRLNASGNLEWQKSLGGSSYNGDVATSVKQTSDGGFIVAGYSSSNNVDVSGNHGGFDYWIVKLDVDGNISWQKSFGGSYNDEANSIQQTADGGYIITGNSQSNDGNVSGNHSYIYGGNSLDCWVIKLDKNGNIVWQKSLGGGLDDYGGDVQQTSDGGFILGCSSASYDGDVTGNHGHSDYWIIKLDWSGNIVWQKSLGGSDNEYCYSIKQTFDGGFVATGVAQSNGGDVTGHHPGYYDYWVVKLDLNGNLIWEKCLGGSGDEYAYAIDQTIDGKFVIAGFSNSIDGDLTINHGGNDYWVVELDNSGNLVWQESLGGSAQDIGLSLDITNDGGIALAGSSQSNDYNVSGNHGDGDFWIVKLSGTPNPSWTPVTQSAPDLNGGVMLLLSDGSVMAKTFTGGSDGYGNTWDKLTPDNHGSYANGTWSTLAPMFDTRKYFGSQVLMSGKVYVAGGEYGSGKKKVEIYDPVVNLWEKQSKPGDKIGDGNSEILFDGSMLQALVTSKKAHDTKIFDPVIGEWLPAAFNCIGTHNESAWVKLPDNSILMVDNSTTNSERFINSLIDDEWTTDANLPSNLSLYDPFGKESGAGFLLPNGHAFFLGSSGHTAYYTPSGNLTDGTWAAGPDIPNGKGTPDAAAALMANGKILCAVSPVPFDNTDAGKFPSPTSFYEFDYTTNSFTQVNAPAGGLTTNIPTFETNMLDLPDGTVLYSQQNSRQYYIYTPSGSPLANWKPTISSITQNSCGLYTISGTLFNGISEGAAYGDDWQMATNYPIVRLTSGTNVYYARDSNWNNTGVQQWNVPCSAQFRLPATLLDGTYSVQVIANGIASDATSYSFVVPPTATITPLGNLDICSAGSVVLQANSGVGYTYQWKKGAAVQPVNSQTYTATSKGTYTVIVTNSVGCSATSAKTKVTKSCKEGEEITEPALAAIKIYPNPAQDQTTIQLTIPKTSHVSIKVYDMSGSEIETLVNGVMEQGDHSLQLNTTTFAKGIYVVKMITDDGIENVKLIVE